MKFFEQVYDVVRQVPAGCVVTYGQIARLLGMPQNARAVGYAMRASPPGTAWHRVVNKAGKPMSTDQRALLESEGVTFNETGFINMKAHLWLDV
ncbi:MAG: MGMT family protein [Oscillospiraceae bacterium]|jgi:methylated-DNA-protein-cysteine methyltransferase-like protein|nr:MGMT family protein [Oscillospiraceae bacterium]